MATMKKPKKKAKKQTKKAVAKAAVKKSKATSAAAAPSVDHAGWSQANDAHKTTFGTLVFFSQFDWSLTFAAVGALQMQQLRFWVASASSTTTQKAAKDFCASFMRIVLTGRPSLTPRAGTQQNDWEAAYDAIETVFLGKTNVVAKIRQELETQYEVW